MRTKKIRLGMIGCSQILPRAIINPSKEIDNIVLYGIASRNPSNAKKYAEEHNILHVFESYLDLLMCDEIDCIYISLPNHLHAEWIIKGLSARKHILVEKPLCLNYKEFCEIEKHYNNADVQLLEGIMVQHHPWQDTIKEIIESNRYGKLNKIDTKICIIPKGNLEENYRGDPEKGGGSFYDLGCYWLQFLQTVTPFEWVSYDSKSNFSGPNGIDMTFEAHLKFKDEIKSSFVSSFEKPYAVNHIMEFENAVITIKDFFRASLGNYKITIKVQETNGNIEKISFSPQNYYTNQLKYFIDILSDSTQKISIKPSGERVKLIEDLFIKARKG